jgi:hypothetical protein
MIFSFFPFFFKNFLLRQEYGRSAMTENIDMFKKKRLETKLPEICSE